MAALFEDGAAGGRDPVPQRVQDTNTMLAGSESRQTGGSLGNKAAETPWERRAYGVPGWGRHGVQRYVRDGCRCTVCCAAADADPARVKKLQRGPAEGMHGTESGYKSYGCRCDRCRSAMVEEWRRRRRAGGSKH